MKNELLRQAFNVNCHVTPVFVTEVLKECLKSYFI